MNKLTTSLCFLITSVLLGQASSKLNNAQNVAVSVANPPFLVGANPVPDGTWQKYNKDAIKWETYNINGFETTVHTIGDLRYQPLLGFTATPTTRTITINGVSQSLASNRVWIVGDITSTEVYNNPTWINTLDYSKITSAPNISLVGLTGDYLDLINRPALFSGSYTDLTNKPAIYSFSGLETQYTRGDGSYTSFPTQVSYFNNDRGYLTTVPAQTWESITGKPTLFSGNYNDLVNKPTIPSAQVQTDWNATTGISSILNKPINISSFANNVGYITTVPAQSFNSLTGKPTTLSGYGITDAYPLTGNPSGFLTNITSTQINTALGFTPYNGSANPNGYITSTSLTTKQDNLVSGTNIKTIETQSLLGTGNIDLTKADVGLSNVDNTSDANKNISIATQTALDLKYNASNPSNYINQAGARTAINLTTTGTGAATYNNTTGTLNIPTPNTAKKQLTYSGVTDATGNYTVVFATPFTVAPNIQQNLIGGSVLQGTLITSITTTGFTIQAYTRSTVSSLPIIGTFTGLLVGAATNPLVGGSVDVIITEK